MYVQKTSPCMQYTFVIIASEAKINIFEYAKVTSLTQQRKGNELQDKSSIELQCLEKANSTL